MRTDYGSSGAACATSRFRGFEARRPENRILEARAGISSPYENCFDHWAASTQTVSTLGFARMSIKSSMPVRAKCVRPKADGVRIASNVASHAEFSIRSKGNLHIDHLPTNLGTGSGSLWKNPKSSSSQWMAITPQKIRSRSFGWEPWMLEKCILTPRASRARYSKDIFGHGLSIPVTGSHLLQRSSAIIFNYVSRALGGPSNSSLPNSGITGGMKN